MAKLTHVGQAGEARMVDVGEKPETARHARASGCIRMSADTLEAIAENRVAKGDVLTVARLAGIMAAKRTAELVPLCHPVSLTDVAVDLAIDRSLPGIRVDASVRTVGRTGVEMEAIVAVSVTLITVYDMGKANDKGMIISEIRLDEKAGGKSGTWTRG